jgi:hypothetical protein
MYRYFNDIFKHFNEYFSELNVDQYHCCIVDGRRPQVIIAFVEAGIAELDYRFQSSILSKQRTVSIR